MKYPWWVYLVGALFVTVLSMFMPFVFFGGAEVGQSFYEMYGEKGQWLDFYIAFGVLFLILWIGILALFTPKK